MTDPEQLANDLEQLQEDVDYLTALLEPALAVTETGDGAAIPPFPTTTPSGAPTPARPTTAHIWNLLTAPEAAAAWTLLTSWVDWLNDRYQLDETLPACWYRHGALIEELDALHAAWHGAYHDPNARPTDPAYWHELLARALSRIHDWDRFGCAAGTHHDEAAATASSDGYREDRDRHVQTDIQARAASHRI